MTKAIEARLRKHATLMAEYQAQGMDRNEASKVAYDEVKRGPQWRVVDQDGGEVFSRETVRNDPCVKNGITTAANFAKRLAKNYVNPEIDAPLRAVKD